ncbi:MAG: branched-chain amino acid transaminase [Candidatus Methanospirare jalkutatii]|nr:branched-chain amino acid transaminase [Candidatus Methanospirare jalkutatii]
MERFKFKSAEEGVGMSEGEVPAKLPEGGKIWFNGRFVEWKDAKVHVLSHGLHYGTGVFEGIRCYSTDKGSFIFRLREHVDRLFRSAKLYGMRIPYSQDEICTAIKETIRINGLDECYIRPIVFYGFHHLGVMPTGCPVECVIAAWKWGAYLGEESLRSGIRCTFSSWHRIHPNTLPTTAKACGHYLNSLLAASEARQKGYDEAIMLDCEGFVAEGPGENIFIVKDGKLLTPDFSSGILPGITRDTVIQLAKDIGIAVEEKRITKSEVLSADEAFFTGTAAEITPIREIDGIIIGNGEVGEITREIQRKFFDVVHAKESKYMKWLEPV